METYMVFFTCKKIFEPIKIGAIELKNKIVMGPMGTSLANNDNSLSDRQIAYYERRAKGGVGMIIIEHAYPQKNGCKSEKSLGIWDKNLLYQWEKLTSAIHGYGCKVAIEIGHLGRCTDFSRLQGDMAIAPSPIRCRVMKEPVRETTIEDINRYQQDYLRAVRIAIKAGFDAIELHFANGYFLAEWISGRTNRRTDIYGGNLENRLRMALEITELVRAEIGANVALLARMASREINGGRFIEESRLIAKALEDAGVDAIDVNAGSLEEYDWEFPSYYMPQGYLIEDAEKIKRSVNILVIGSGRIVEPRMAEQAISDGRIDMVGINRALIAEPDWPNKTMEGKFGQIRRCIACTRCIHEKESDGIICSVNPFVGHEGDWVLKKTDQLKNILIVGGGPAGLQASLIAALQGHKVTLTEKSEYLGGMIRVAAMAPLKWEIGGIVTTLAELAFEAGVDIRTNHEATPEWIKNGGYDEVILACGSSPIRPNIEVADGVSESNAIDVMMGLRWPGQRVAIIGGGMIGCECAEYLVPFGKNVIIFEKFDEVARDMSWNLRQNLFSRLKSGHVKIKTGAEVSYISSGKIVYKKSNYERLAEGVDSVIFAVGLMANKQLKKSLDEIGIASIEIGDSNEVGRLREAMIDAVKAAIDL
ncbi:MAG: FAD-dependent oxidoreductase [Synergistaceae bacterium]|jgi:2,4-dienoyl-CoA reductase-like NADH-dependent reductase (Old Yellow Enzyme family)/thioredoxin reductase|nr:FAD-dependent oxidoreductase [Synergistaceae bacterium]